VLRACGIDPDVYQGFAWGMGIDRIAMLKYGIADLRQLFENDVRWLNHYGFQPLDMPTLAGGLSDMEETSMNLDDVKTIAQQTLSAQLGNYGFDHVDIRVGKDHDEEDALFMTAKYRSGSSLPGGDVLVSALTNLRQNLQQSGEERFPYLSHRLEDEEAGFEDEDSPE
jgi:hypothetical protein